MTQKQHFGLLPPHTRYGEFKFRANDGWDINLGGDINNLSFGADNIPVTEEGTYEISLDLSDSKQFKEIVKL